MFRALAIQVGLLALVTAACGHKIGDSCSVASDCSQDGTRVCDTFSPGGYCTVQNCDYGTCPEDSACIRFLPALENAPTCSAQADCAIDELCTIGGQCAPTSIEQRFCMATCGDNGDCRDAYECRNRDLMMRHGGEPVPDPTSASATVPSTKFCGPRRTCTQHTDCDSGEECSFETKVCVPM